jgi:hypothetical protein
MLLYILPYYTGLLEFSNKFFAFLKTLILMEKWVIIGWG